MAEIDYVEGRTGSVRIHRLGFLIEDIDELGARNGLKEIKTEKIERAQLNADAVARSDLFQYMIGNQDWSDRLPAAGRICCHNIRLLRRLSRRSARFNPRGLRFRFRRIRRRSLCLASRGGTHPHRSGSQLSGSVPIQRPSDRSGAQPAGGNGPSCLRHWTARPTSLSAASDRQTSISRGFLPRLRTPISLNDTSSRNVETNCCPWPHVYEPSCLAVEEWSSECWRPDTDRERTCIGDRSRS